MALSQSTIKSLKSLHLKKYRQKYNNFIAEGDKIVCELLEQSFYSVQRVYGTAEWLAKNQNIVENSGVNFQEINDKSLRLISQLKNPNKVLAVVEMPETSAPSNLFENWAIFLDGLQDPGNVGTILRIADWFAIPTIIAGPGTVDLYNSKVLQASMGAFLRVRWSTMDYQELEEHSKETGLWIADMGGQDVFKVTIPTAGILVVGNEGKGVSQDVRSFNPKTLSISSPNGGAESLNAAVATGIICAAIRR